MDLKNTYTQKQQQKKRKRLTYHKTLREVMIKEVCPTVPVHKNLSMLMQICMESQECQNFYIDGGFFPWNEKCLLGYFVKNVHISVTTTNRD